MNIAIGNQMIADNLGAAERFRLAKQAGLDGVEIWLGTPDATMETTDTEVRRLREALDQAGVACSSVASTLGWQSLITDPDDAVFARSIEIGRRQIEAAEMLGATAVLMVTGRVLPTVPYRQAWDRMVTGFRELCPYAEERGVRIGAETCPGLSKNLMTPGECLTFVDAVGHPAIGVYLDTANVTYSGYAQDFIRDLGPRLVRIHAKDFTAPDDKGGHRATWPGNGTVDWAPIAAACKDVGYDEWAVLEFGPLPGEAKGLELMKTACEATRRAFGG